MKVVRSTLERERIKSGRLPAEKGSGKAEVEGRSSVLLWETVPSVLRVAFRVTLGRSAGTRNTRQRVCWRGKGAVVSAASPMIQRCCRTSMRTSAGTGRPSRDECRRHSSTTPWAMLGRY